jgi:thiol-disulfide isomerase/thioredoxin
MKRLSLLFIAVIPFFAMTQKLEKSAESVDGVHFIHKISNWDDIISRAKKENKFVFVDCYTTWCGPCKYVSGKVFPLKNVGDFYNTNFVNVGLQLDQTKKDNEDVITTRAVAKQIEKDYKIVSYPTFLIFDNTGKLVHKFVGAGNDNMMIENAKAALTKNGQYFTLLDEYNAGKRDGILIGNLCKAATAAGENPNEYIKTFISVTDNLFTKENAEMLLNNVRSSDGAAFNHLYKNRMVWSQFLEKEKFDAKMKVGVLTEILEYVAKQRTKNINWADVESTFGETYPEYIKEQIVRAKAMFSLQVEDWQEFEDALKTITRDFPNSDFNDEELNAYAWGIFENLSNKTLLNQALIWSKKTLGKDNPAYLDTYANILYKLGQTKEAIEIETKVLNGTTDQDEKKSYEETLDKMKKGKPTWK